jgi:hypothetical protein
MLIHDVDQIAHETPEGAESCGCSSRSTAPTAAGEVLDRAVDIAASNHAQLTIAGVVPAPAWLALGTPGLSALSAFTQAAAPPRARP